MKEDHLYQTNTGEQIRIIRIYEGYAIGQICVHGTCKFVPLSLDGVSWDKKLKLEL